MKNKPENPQWIKSDQKPRGNKNRGFIDILFCDVGNNVFQGRYNPRTKNFLDMNFTARVITYWMPLPKPPKTADAMLAERSKSDE